MPDKLYWHCALCGNHETAQLDYAHGDSEPCRKCVNGTARVMTSKEAAAIEQAYALGCSHEV